MLCLFDDVSIPFGAEVFQNIRDDEYEHIVTMKAQLRPPDFFGVDVKRCLP